MAIKPPMLMLSMADWLINPSLILVWRRWVIPKYYINLQRLTFMKTIYLQSPISQVEISPVETTMILRALRLIVEKIPLWEFQTRIGYYVEEVNILIEKLSPTNSNNQTIENQCFSFNIDELIILKNALNECGYCVTTKSIEKELFQDVKQLIGQMRNGA